MLSRMKGVLSPSQTGASIPPPKRVISKENEGDVYLFIHGIDAAHSLLMPNYDIEHAHFSIIIDIAGESHGEIVSGYEIYIGICDDSTPTTRFFFPKWTRRICRRGLEVRCLGKISGISNSSISYDDQIFTWKQGMDKHASQVYQRLVSESGSPSTTPPPSPTLSPRDPFSSLSSSPIIINTIPISPPPLQASTPPSKRSGSKLKLSTGSLSLLPSTLPPTTSSPPSLSISPSHSYSGARAWSSRLNSQQFARVFALSLGLVWPVDVPMASNDQVPIMFDREMLLYSIPKRYHDTPTEGKTECVIS